MILTILLILFSLTIIGQNVWNYKISKIGIQYSENILWSNSNHIPIVFNLNNNTITIKGDSITKFTILQKTTYTNSEFGAYQFKCNDINNKYVLIILYFFNNNNISVCIHNKEYTYWYELIN